MESPSKNQETASPKQVFVSGYPSYTQSEDLIKVFNQYGAVNVDKINNKFAVMTFASGTEAVDAIEDSGKVNIYGEFLTVKKFTGKIEPATPKRDFPKSKEKGGAIIEPKFINLTGDFYVQLDNVLEAVRLTQEEVTSLSRLYADLEWALQQAWPGCVAVPFGSITTGLGIKTSDADCFIRIPYNAQTPHANGNHVYKAKRILQQYSDTFVEILAIPRANTPIVKLFHVPTKTNCDVTFKTPLGSQNSKLIAFLLHVDARLIPLAVLVKYWAKIHGFTGTGKLTNYALTMLIIFYLQQSPVSILPSVSWLQQNPADEFLVDSWNTGFMHQLDMIPKSTNTSSISELLGGFLQYYANFNFDELIVCTFMGVPIKKDMFKDLKLLPAEFSRYKCNVETRVAPPLKFTRSMCIQDPFELCHNVASAVSSKLSAEILAFFKFAATAYDKEKLNNCAGLLKTILIQKPKLPKGKHNPEYRAVIYPHFLQAIINPDWKSVIREVTMMAFEQMCHIKLTKMEEKSNPEARKQKEKFSGVVTKAIWKRKQFTKLYNMMDVTFVEKQKRITSEIMNVDKDTFKINIQIILTFAMEPKHAVVSMKILDGDGTKYREFGKFFVGTLHGWFITLLKAYLHSNKVENASNNRQITPKTELDENVNISNVSQSDSDTSQEDNDNDKSEGENNNSTK